MDNQKKHINQIQKINSRHSVGLWKKIRNNANYFFENHGWPNRNLESWHYTSMQPMADRNIVLAKYSNINAQSKGFKIISDLINNYCREFKTEMIKLVFVNGRFEKEFSDVKELKKHHIYIKMGQDFLSHKEDQNFIYEFIHERRAVNFEPHSSMEALNTCKFTDGIFIRIEKEQNVSTPIHIINVSLDADSNADVLPLIQNKIFIEVCPFAKVNFVESYIGEKKYFVNNTTEVVLRKSSYMGYYQVNADSEQSTHVSTSRFFQHECSQLDCRTVTLGGQLNRLNIEFYLRQKECSLSSKGFYIGSRDSHTDHSSFIDHVVGHCQSTQLYKGLLTDTAKGIFDGKVQIRKNSQKANSEQLIKNLLLSNKAEACTKPQLLIHADDVKATHGSTVGQINPEELFYFESRAINKKMAIKMLSLGFVEDIIFEIENKTIREFLLMQTEIAFEKQIHF